MSDALEPLFAPAEKSLRIGKEALIELDSILSTYFASGPYERTVEQDIEAGQQNIKYTRRIPFPEFEVDRKINEALVTLKHAFDQAAWATARALNSRVRDTDVVYFPWADSPEGVGKRLGGKSSLIPNEFWNSFLSLKPHCGTDGNPTTDDVCRRLAQIANRKHSVGIVTAVQPSRCNISIKAGEVIHPGKIEFFPGVKKFWKPVKDEFIAYTIGLGSDFQNQETVYLYIAFDRTTPLPGEPVPQCLASFFEKAEQAIHVLKAKAAELLGE